MQNPRYGDGRDILPIVWKGLLNFKSFLREGSQKKLRKFGHMSKLQVGMVFLSHTFSEKKVWT